MREMMEAMEAMGLTSSVPSKFKKKRFGVTGNVEEEEADEQAGAGFLVTISGYSPYENINDLMDPVGVENDKSKWGLVTWLMHTDEIADGNSPFKLHKKAELQHFRLMKGEVDFEGEMPVGIGIEAIRSNGSKIRVVESTESGRPALAEDEEQVLIDPMTKEVISKVTKLDEDGKKMYDVRGQEEYENNDYWFVLNVKFIWKDAPKTP